MADTPALVSDPTVPPLREWVGEAVARLNAPSQGETETPLCELAVPGMPGLRLLCKDESAHPTGSLKHRLARSLFLYALCSGRLRPGQTVIDASSGSTAISEAWFARQLGLPFVAVMPETTGQAKQQAVLELGGRCELTAAGSRPVDRARSLSAQLDACYLDQFGLATIATDWRGNNNIAQSLLEQCRQVGVADPDWIVCGAGTGGTSATLGRYLRYAGSPSRLCVAEPSGAAFALGWQRNDRGAIAHACSLIEGIGRAQVEPCFAFELAERVIEVDDQDSIAACWLLERWCGRRFGGSSGTNLVAALELGYASRRRPRGANIALLLCDQGARYADTLYSSHWLRSRGIDIDRALARLQDRYGLAAVPSPFIRRAGAPARIGCV